MDADKKYYIVLINKDSIDLEEEVNAMLDEGFELYGSPFYNPDQKVYHQAMVKVTLLDATSAYNDYVEDLLAEENGDEDDLPRTYTKRPNSRHDAIDTQISEAENELKEIDMKLMSLQTLNPSSCAEEINTLKKLKDDKMTKLSNLNKRLQGR